WHPAQDEHFEVLTGSVRVRVGDEQRTLRVGESIDIPSGTVHQFWNPGTEPARVLWQVRPAGRSADWFTSVDALRETGGFGRVFAFAVLLTEYRDVFRLATPAAPVVRIALAALAPIGRLLGHRPVAAPRD